MRDMREMSMTLFVFMLLLITVVSAIHSIEDVTHQSNREEREGTEELQNECEQVLIPQYFMDDDCHFSLSLTETYSHCVTTLSVSHRSGSRVRDAQEPVAESGVSPRVFYSL